MLRDAKRQMLNRIMRSLRSWKLPPGDYLEFGVYRGLSFLHAYKLAQKYQLDYMRFYAFDSFEGLQDDTEESEKKYNHFCPGQYACSEEEFRSILTQAGVDIARITILPVFYVQPLTEALEKRLPIKRAAVVWIDCDLYASFHRPGVRLRD